MKVFKCESLLFELPDNFDGTLSDVFQLMADYTRTKTDGKFVDCAEKKDSDSSYENILAYVDYYLTNRNSKVEIQYGLLDIDKLNKEYCIRFRKRELDNILQEG